jgi:Apea-like HEPN
LNSDPLLPYAAVYRLSLPTPTDVVDILHDDERSVTIVAGALGIDYTVPVVMFGEGSAGATMAVQSLRLPPAAYAIIEVGVSLFEVEGQPTSSDAALLAAEVGCVMELLYPGITSAKEFEGIVSSEGSYAMCMEGPLEIVALPNQPIAEIAQSIAQALETLNGLSEAQRSRFRLASRWFRRGCEATSRVDKLLFWWTVLEVFPAEGTSDVPRKVVDLLHREVYPDILLHDLKNRIGIGRIFGTRSKIVHDGLAFVSDLDLEFRIQLRQLRAITSICLRLLAGLPLGHDLDTFVRTT